MRSQRSTLAYLALATLGCAASGCGNTDDLDSPVETRKGAIRSQVLATDGSGRVHIEIVTCTGDVLRGIHTHDLCPVDPEFVLIGGGATVLQVQPYGALLTESRPADDGVNWQASSKEHTKAFSHQLSVHAIGLRLDGVSATSLRTMVQIVRGPESSLSNQPAGSVTLSNDQINQGFIVLGGGGELRWTRNEGILLIMSKPSGLTGWQIKGKDHGKADNGTATAFLVAFNNPALIAANPTLYPRGLEVLNGQGNPVSVTQGVGVSTGSISNGFVVAGYGGESTWTGSKGRMLFGMGFDMGLTNNAAASVKVQSKDHLAADGGITTAFFSQIHRRP